MKSRLLLFLITNVSNTNQTCGTLRPATADSQKNPENDRRDWFFLFFFNLFFCLWSGCSKVIRNTYISSVLTEFEV